MVADRQLLWRSAFFVQGSIAIWVATLAAVMALHALPLRAVYDIGSQPAPISGLHGSEYNAAMSYAYSRGQSLMLAPMVGAGAYEVLVRMGSPGERDPLPTSIEIGERSIAIGHVRSIRVFRFLAPADVSGALAVRLTSATIQPPDESRRLGVLFDRLEIRSKGWALPALQTLGVALTLIGSAWIAVTLLVDDRRLALALLALASLGTVWVVWVLRGQSASPVLWSVAAAVVAMFGALAARPPSWLVRQTLLAVALLVGVWRVALWVVAWVALQTGAWLSPLAQLTVSDVKALSAWSIPPYVPFDQAIGTAWSQWDSRLYLSIATLGYQHPPEEYTNMAFLPFYPLLIRMALPFTGGSAIAAGLIVTHSALFAGALIFADVIKRDFDAQTAYRTIATLLCFPTSFFLGAVYAESVALALLALTLWGLRRQRWMLAGIAGFFLSLTRLPGVLIAPVIALAALEHAGWRRSPLTCAYLAPLLPVFGLGLFMAYQWWRFGSPLIFMQTQYDIWDQRLSPPWVQLSMMIETIITGANHWSGRWPTRVLQLVVWLAFAGLTVIALLRLPLIYGLTTVMMLAPAYLTNVSHSLPRYVLLALPAFIAAAQLIEHHPLLRLATLAALVLLVWATALFVNGFFMG
ncbi:MAG: hypothetical protein NZ699_11800 [Roseiflexus sp.]|nr:hypothetical protein [Roseiflexus sp.]MCS7289805.1 hypothetical protein [Roseiflexus sp.]MDW8145711.1 hypothetical protein [Roseiflexaceae bacterium]MDW8233347.1 hypothetical protein [Roseiflexaceae bacterium]